MTRDELINSARSYLGTPFHHQGRLPHVGLDCAGLVVCAASENGYAVDDVRGYANIPSQGLFTQSVMGHCDKINIDELQAGDLCMFAFTSEPQHIAIVSSVEPLKIIHAYLQVNKVVENNLDGFWLKKLRGCYRLKGVE